MGTFIGVRKYVMTTFATTQSQLMKKRVAKFMLSTECAECKGKRLRKESLSVKFAGLDTAEMSRLPMKQLADKLKPFAAKATSSLAFRRAMPENAHPEKVIVAQRITEDLESRLKVLLDL